MGCGDKTVVLPKCDGEAKNAENETELKNAENETELKRAENKTELRKAENETELSTFKGKCYKCNAVGHKAHQCPEKKNQVKKN